MMERIFTVYGTADNDCVKECRKRDYSVLEQIYDLEEGSHVEVEFRDYNLFKGKELTRNFPQKSRAVTLFINDMLAVKNGDKNTRKLLSSYVMYYEADEIMKQTNDFYLDREVWILACQDFIEKIGKTRRASDLSNHDGYMFEALNTRGDFNFMITFDEATCTPAMKDFLNGCQGLGPDYLLGSCITSHIFSHVLVPYYWELQGYLQHNPWNDDLRLDGLKVGVK